VARPRRTVAAQPTRVELLVFTEGQVTEEDYLNHWHRHYRARVNVEIDDFHGTPKALVERASEAKRNNKKAEKRGRGRAHDEVWCVFDVDTHPHLTEAIEMAAANGINVAVSNPCIELWFLLHFEGQTAYIETQPAQKAAKEHLSCEKALSEAALEELVERLEVAKERAIRLDDKHQKDRTPAPGNPSSGVWRIVDSISGT
jgi:hypothetical protein